MTNTSRRRCGVGCGTVSDLLTYLSHSNYGINTTTTTTTSSSSSSIVV